MFDVEKTGFHITRLQTLKMNHQRLTELLVEGKDEQEALSENMRATFIGTPFYASS